MIKQKGVYLLFVFLMGILFPVSLGAEKLPLYQKYQGPLKPGIEITKDNFDTYLPELKKLFPPAKLKWYTMGLTKGMVTIPIVETTNIPNTIGHQEATRKYGGSAKVADNNDLINWTAGFPFPEPKNALEIIWNSYGTISRTSAHDELYFRAWYGLFGGTKYEKYFIPGYSDCKYRGRTDMLPLGDLSAFKNRGICLKESTLVFEPHEIKGFIQLRIKYWDIDKDDEVYGYIPAIRRIRRFTGSDLTDPMLGSDMVMDDFEVFRQKITSEMKFRVLELRDFLVPRGYVGLENKPAYDYHKHGPCYQVEWEIRPQWVLEVLLNDPDYAYSKRILYIDGVPLNKGGVSLLYWGEMYDQKNRLWKANGMGAQGCNKEGFKNMFYWMYMNVLVNHYTVMDVHPYYVPEKTFRETFPLDEARHFTVRGLIKSAR